MQGSRRVHSVTTLHLFQLLRASEARTCEVVFLEDRVGAQHRARALRDERRLRLQLSMVLALLRLACSSGSGGNGGNADRYSGAAAVGTATTIGSAKH